MRDDAEPINPSEVAHGSSGEGSRAKRLTAARIAGLAKVTALTVAVTMALIFVATPAGSKILKFLGFDKEIEQNAARMMREGRQTFRHDTFGDEAFWGGLLDLHLAIEGTRFGGVGPGLSPRAALGLGLKVDVDALPPGLVKQLRQGGVNRDDPAVTLALLRHDAVVGVKGFFGDDDGLRSVGITCALCH